MANVRKFSGGRPGARGKLNDLVNTRNSLQSIVGDQFIGVDKNAGGHALRLNIQELISRIPRTSGGGTNWCWARVRQVIDSTTPGDVLSVRVMRLNADYSAVQDSLHDRIEYWDLVYLHGAEATVLGTTDPYTGSQLRMCAIVPTLAVWTPPQQGSGTPIRIVRGYDGYWWNVDPFTDRALAGVQRALVISVGTNTLTCKRATDATPPVAYGDSFTVNVQGVTAARVLTATPVLADASPLFAANNTIYVRYTPGVNAWSWVGLAPETCT